MAKNDTTASILESIVSTHYSPYVSLNPREPLLTNNAEPIHPTVRAVANVKPHGHPRPSSFVTFTLPSSPECGIHMLEQLWLEVPVTTDGGYMSDLSYYPGALRIISAIELRTNDGVVIETLTPNIINMWQRVNVPTQQLETLRDLANGLYRTTLQLALPLSIIKDGVSFPLLSLTDSYLQVRIKFAPSTEIAPGIDIAGAHLWMKGITIPDDDAIYYEKQSWSLPITTMKEQRKLYEKGNIRTLEAMLLNDARDLQEVYFAFRQPGELNPLKYINSESLTSEGLDIYSSFSSCWLELGTDKLSHPVRKGVVRVISCIGRHARVPKLNEGLHILPVSNATQPSLTGFSSPGLVTHAHSKINLRLHFDGIDNEPGVRDPFELVTVLVRRQLLHITGGIIEQLDELQGKEDNDKFPTIDGFEEYTPVYLSTPSPMDTKPDDIIGYLTKTIKHEPFSRMTRSIALRGSHRFGETIVGVIPITMDLLSNLVFRLRLPPLPTGLRWINGVGYYLMERILIKHEDAVLFDAPGEALFLMEQQDDDPAYRIRRDAIDKGYRAPGTIASIPTYGSPDGTLQIPIPWSFSAGGYSPLPTACFRDRSLRVEIKLASIEDLVVPDSVDIIDPNEIFIKTTNCDVECPPLTPQEIRSLALGFGEEPVITETTLDVTGFTLPSQMREQIVSKPRIIMTRQLHVHRFDDSTGKLRVLPISHGLRRILYASPRNNQSAGGERAYDDIKLQQIYASSTGWYKRIPPTEFFEEWSRISQGTGSPDQHLYCISFKPGFINASRFDELRIQTTPGRLLVVAETTEPYRIQEGKIGALYVD